MANSRINPTAAGNSPVGFHPATVLLSILTLLLLVIGALVTSNEAGDSVPDWPMSFGRWMLGADQFSGNVRYEYSHRVVAGVVGIVTLILTVWAHTAKNSRRSLRNLTLSASVVVVLQALLGGVRVLFPAAKPAIAVPHALIAQSFFCITVALAIVTSRSWNLHRGAIHVTGLSSAKRLTLIAIVAIAVQLVLGAAFRHGAFSVIPHIAGAVAVALLVVSICRRILGARSGGPYLRGPAIAALILLVLQLTLGVLAYIARLESREAPQPLEPMISLTVAHVVVGALLFAATLVLAMRLHQSAGEETETVEKKAPGGLVPA